MAFLFRLLLECYFPFLLLLCMAMAGAMAYLIGQLGSSSVPILLLPLIVLLGLTLAQVFWAARVLTSQPPAHDFLELQLPRDQTEDLFEFVAGIARELRLPGPQDIRMAADTIAHVYENRQGMRILVLGGLAMTAFTQKALAGIIAHELGHFAAGDTRLSRRGYHRAGIIALLEHRVQTQFATHLNPLVWILRLYHLLYQLAWAATSREQEFAADKLVVALVGKRVAAAALIHVTVTERLPWVRLTSIARSCVSTNQPMEQIFAEARQRSQTIDRADWEDALRRELARPTELFDTHPSLKARLKALGISPRKALALALDQTGARATALVPTWDRIERELTERLMTAVRVDHAAKMEMAQIFLGGPVTRP
jgi:Zn-dependent protease with chaperone function